MTKRGKRSKSSKSDMSGMGMDGMDLVILLLVIVLAIAVMCQYYWQGSKVCQVMRMPCGSDEKRDNYLTGCDIDPMNPNCD